MARISADSMNVKDSGLTSPGAPRRTRRQPANDAPSVNADSLMRRVQAQRAAGDLVLAQRFPGAAHRHADQAAGHEQREAHQQQPDQVQEDHHVLAGVFQPISSWKVFAPSTLALRAISRPNTVGFGMPRCRPGRRSGWSGCSAAGG
jgi:hypothetical protein